MSKKPGRTISLTIPNGHEHKINHLRAMSMLNDRIAGMQVKDIAAKHNCSRSQVQRLLQYAVREGLTLVYENQIINQLVPKAVGVYTQALDEGDITVAKDVLDKLVKLGERFSEREEKQEQQSLEAYLANRRNTKKDTPSDAGTTAKPVGSGSTVTGSTANHTAASDDRDALYEPSERPVGFASSIQHADVEDDSEEASPDDESDAYEFAMANMAGATRQQLDTIHDERLRSIGK